MSILFALVGGAAVAGIFSSLLVRVLLRLVPADQKRLARAEKARIEAAE